MKTANRVKVAITFVIVFCIMCTPYVQAQTIFLLKSVTASVNGSSSLHDWKSTITKIEFKGSLKTEGNALKSIKDVEIKIPVESIKSDEGKIMDHKTFEAFDSHKNPYIIYTLSNAQIKSDADQIIIIEASGKLTMSGTTRPITLTSKGKVLPNGDVQLSISKKLKMTDFKIVPPTAVLGTIKVGDEITVNFDLVLTHAVTVTIN